MTLLPDGFAWVEYERADDPFWRGLRQLLIGFVAFDGLEKPYFLGTGFVIAKTSTGDLLVLTARHVVEDGAIHAQNAQKNDVKPAGFMAPMRKPELGPVKFRAIWMSLSESEFMHVTGICYSNQFDIALCVVTISDSSNQITFRGVPSVALDMRCPHPGDQILLATLTDFVFDKNDNTENIYTIKTRPIVRAGRVLSVEESSMGHKGKCLRISIPTLPGMSGGFAYSAGIDGEPISAFGIISQGSCGDEKIKEFAIPGNTAVVHIHAALGLEIASDPEISRRNLAGLVSSGDIIARQ